MSLVSVPALKPCPWCGCAMEVNEHTKTRSQWRWFVQHVMFEGGPDCHFDDLSFKERSVEQAVAAWNNRRGEAPVPETRVEEIRAELERDHGPAGRVVELEALLAVAREAALSEAATMLGEWADSDFARGDGTTGDAIRTAAICVRELINPAATQPCGCEGCPTEVPRFWRSAICRLCANEDCEHEDDGEKSTATGGATP